MEVIEDDFGEHIGAADDERFARIARPKVRDEDGVERANDAPTDRFDEAAKL